MVGGDSLCRTPTFKRERQGRCLGTFGYGVRTAFGVSWRNEFGLICLGKVRHFGGGFSRSPISLPLVPAFGADQRGSVRDEYSLHQIDSIVFTRKDVGQCGRVRKAAN